MRIGFIAAILVATLCSAVSAERSLAREAHFVTVVRAPRAAEVIGYVIASNGSISRRPQQIALTGGTVYLLPPAQGDAPTKAQRRSLIDLIAKVTAWGHRIYLDRWSLTLPDGTVYREHETMHGDEESFVLAVVGAEQPHLKAQALKTLRDMEKDYREVQVNALPPGNPLIQTTKMAPCATQ